MANEIRVRANNLQGTITNNPLVAASVLVSSAGFVDLPTIGVTNHMVIILDPLEINGAAEIVQVTNHAAANSLITVVRGFEGTTPRDHPLGTTWFHGPVVSDYNYTQRTALSTNRPPSPYVGETIYETNTARWTAWNGSAWIPAPFNVPTCRIFHNAAQSVNNATDTTPAFNSERFDTDSMHDNATNNSRITFTTAGVYLLTAQVEWASAADYTLNYIYFHVNGVTSISVSDPGTANVVNTARWNNVSTVYKFAAADYVELRVHQRNGAAAARNLLSTTNYSPEMTATWIGVG